MDELKVCPRCGRVLPIGDFYFHEAKQKYDKFCKECKVKINHENYLAYGHKVTTLNKYREMWSIANLSREVKRLGFDTKGMELHHWNYNLPRQVYLMSRSAHRKLHRYLRVNNDDNLVYTKDNVCLDTIDKAESFYKEVFKRCGIVEPLRLISV